MPEVNACVRTIAHAYTACALLGAAEAVNKVAVCRGTHEPAASCSTIGLYQDYQECNANVVLLCSLAISC